MKLLMFAVVCSILLVACSPGVKVDQRETFTARTRQQAVFVVPFTTIMVPAEVTEGLFDRFVDRLNDSESQSQHDFIILKQGGDKIATDWLNRQDYVVGEVFAYVEDFGSTMVSIRAKSRISLFQPGHADATFRVDYPIEIFYEKDYMTLGDARRKLAVKISDSMAQRLTEALAGG